MSITQLPMLLSRQSGKIIAWPVDDTGAVTGGGNDFGHVTSALLGAPGIEEVEEKSRRPENYDETIRTEAGTVEQTVTFVSKTNSIGNIKAALAGTQTDVTQAAGNDAAPVNVTAYLGKMIDLGKYNLDTGTPPVVTDIGAVTTYVEDTDYQIDYINGIMYILEGGSISDEEVLEVTKTWLERSYVTTQANKNFSQFWKLGIFGENEISGEPEQLIFPKCTIKPSGDLARITEDATSYQEFSFEAKLSKLGDDYFQHNMEA